MLGVPPPIALFLFAPAQDRDRPSRRQSRPVMTRSSRFSPAVGRRSVQRQKTLRRPRSVRAGGVLACPGDDGRNPSEFGKIRVTAITALFRILRQRFWRADLAVAGP